MSYIRTFVCPIVEWVVLDSFKGPALYTRSRHLVLFSRHHGHETRHVIGQHGVYSLYVPLLQWLELLEVMNLTKMNTRVKEKTTLNDW